MWTGVAASTAIGNQLAVHAGSSWRAAGAASQYSSGGAATNANRTDLATGGEVILLSRLLLLQVALFR